MNGRPRSCGRVPATSSMTLISSGAYLAGQPDAFRGRSAAKPPALNRRINSRTYSSWRCNWPAMARARSPWPEKDEPNHVAGKLTEDLLAYCGDFPARDGDHELCEHCQRIAGRLQSSAPVAEIEAITPNTDGREFEVLAKSVREAIDKNEPEAGLDRLHTFLVKYVRAVCQKHGVTTERDKPLHSLMGEYIKRLKGEGLVESEMAERILKSAISTMEAFNRVRNNQSLAHDNPVLTYSESLLIFVAYVAKSQKEATGRVLPR